MFLEVCNLAQAHHYILEHSVAEAPACRLKKLAQAAIAEAGDSLSTKVLEKAANTTCLRNAERDLHNLFRREGMVIAVHPETVRLGKVDLPLIYLRTWFDYLLGAHPEYLLGGFQKDQSAQLLLSTYWDNMEHIMPDHHVFSMFDRETRSRCIPFYLHMDEGVSQRKRAILVIAAQGCFGLNTADRYHEAYTLAGGRSCDDAATCMSGAQFHSSKGNTFKSRFLFTAIPKKNYTKANDDVYHGALRLLAEECCSLMQSGVLSNGTRYYPICMGMKGDGPALGKAGYFTRYFASMGKAWGRTVAAATNALQAVPGFLLRIVVRVLLGSVPLAFRFHGGRTVSALLVRSLGRRSHRRPSTNLTHSTSTSNPWEGISFPTALC